jgi:hypothetical protein
VKSCCLVSACSTACGRLHLQLLRSSHLCLFEPPFPTPVARCQSPAPLFSAPFSLATPALPRRLRHCPPLRR